MSRNRLTYNFINHHIQNMGINAELVKGDGYHYFVGDDVEHAEATSIMVSKLNDFSLERWIEELRSFIKSSESRNDFYKMSK